MVNNLMIRTNKTWSVYGIASFILCFLFSLSLTQRSSAQFNGGGFGGGGFSNASFSSSRAGYLPPSNSIFVEEFYNYHRHDIRLPEDDEAVSLDMRFGCPSANDREKVHYLQIGLATPRDRVLKEAKPINVCFVIDRSGSMAGDRISNVKNGLIKALESLRETDTVSIVTFATETETVIEPQNVSEISLLQEAIEGIHVNGKTNLAGGLVQGLKLVNQNFNPQHNNCLILLTDGLANVGETDSEEIISDAMPFIDQGVDITTIGVGSDFNHELMRQLATAGRGLLHFVNDDEDLEKVFVDEIDGLLSGAITDIKLSLQFETGLIVEHVYGFSPKSRPTSIRFDLDPIRAGTTEVVLLRCRVADNIRKPKSLAVRAHISFKTSDSKEEHEIQERIELRYDPVDFRRINPLSDPSVKRNTCIAVLADGIKVLAEQEEKGRFERAKPMLEERVNQVLERYPMGVDKEVQRVIDIAEGYMR